MCPHGHWDPGNLQGGRVGRELGDAGAMRGGESKDEGNGDAGWLEAGRRRRCASRGAGT